MINEVNLFSQPITNDKAYGNIRKFATPIKTIK